MRGGRDILVQVGQEALAGTLPYLPTRLALNGAFREACGLDEAGSPMPAGDGQDLVLVYAAAIGCCCGELLELPPLRSLGRDLFLLGEAAYEALSDRGHPAADIVEAGRVTFLEIVQSIPRVQEVADERGNFPSPVESCIGSS